jgi:hypothetical protein
MDALGSRGHAEFERRRSKVGPKATKIVDEASGLGLEPGREID